jgi:PEP-CTERM motif
LFIFAFDDVSRSATSVPEPTRLILMSAGLAGAAFRKRIARSRKDAFNNDLKNIEA